MWKHLIARLLLPQLLIIGSLSGSEVYELATSRPPDSGSVENLPASWTGGSARPEAVTLSVRLEKGDRLSKIVLTSRSPNTPRHRVTAGRSDRPRGARRDVPLVCHGYFPVFRTMTPSVLARMSKSILRHRLRT